MLSARARRFAGPFFVLGAMLWSVLTAHGADRIRHPARSALSRPRLDSPPPQLTPPALADVTAERSHALMVPEKLRLLVVAPHPDDETLGAGGLLQRVLARGGQVRVLFITNGDGFSSAVAGTTRERQPSRGDFLAYGERRRHEALTALRTLTDTDSPAVFLGFPDGGIDDLWGEHWLDDHPYRSPFTNSDRPPYAESQRQGLDYSGVDLQRAVQQALRGFAPDWLVIPDPRDLHPDHCTTGGFVLDALRELREAHIAPFSRTQVLTYLIHAPEYPGNPMWRRIIATAGIGGTAAAHEHLADTTWMHLDLAPDEIRRKDAAVRAYRTQLQVMDRFLALFVRADEIFGRLDGAQVSALPLDYARRWRPHRVN
jgi:LmbE family N-acetylglucosaminyl deacetylase